MKILILSDIHGNFTALQTVLNKEKNYDKIFFLGDAVDYGPNPKPCLDFIRERVNYYVRGNHDNALGYGVSCNSMGSFRRFSEETRAWHNQILPGKYKDFLRKMPKELYVKEGGYTFFLTHASPAGNISEYLYPEDFTEDLVLNIKADFILVGHSHLQFEKQVGGKLVVNPGSVGLSREDSKANYAIFEEGKFTLKKIDYDVQKTIEDLQAAPLPPDVKEGLEKVLRHKQ